MEGQEFRNVPVYRGGVKVPMKRPDFSQYNIFQFYPVTHDGEFVDPQSFLGPRGPHVLPLMAPSLVRAKNLDHLYTYLYT